MKSHLKNPLSSNSNSTEFAILLSQNGEEVFNGALSESDREKLLLLHEKSATPDNEKPPKEVAEDHKKHLEDVMIRDSNPKFQVRSLKYYRSGTK